MKYYNGMTEDEFAKLSDMDRSHVEHQQRLYDRAWNDAVEACAVLVAMYAERCGDIGSSRLWVDEVRTIKRPEPKETGK